MNLKGFRQDLLQSDEEMIISMYQRKGSLGEGSGKQEKEEEFFMANKEQSKKVEKKNKPKLSIKDKQKKKAEKKAAKSA